MTKLLLRLFVKNYKEPEQASVRSGVGKLSGIVGIVCNLLLFGFKLVVGTLSGAVSITADAMNNLSDATSAVVTFIGFKLAEKPADADHPYGHARYEYLSGLAVAGLIVVIGFELAKTSVEKILHPTEVLFTLPVCIVLIGSILMKLWMCLFNRHLGKYIHSTTLLATAADSRNDAVSTTAVLIAGVLSTAFGWQIDGWMGLAVALFILYSGVMLAKETISPLLGENASPELREQIEKLVKSVPEVLGYHDLMVHDYGPGQRFASMHVEMDQRADPLTCHELIDNLERACLQQLQVNLIIHYDPVVTDDPEMNRMRQVVQDLLRQQDSRISIHDFRMVRGQGHSNLIFDAELPPEMMQHQQNIKKQLDKDLAESEAGTYYTVVTFDMGSPE
jgi:cation diffusion facilitator family transporter